MAYPEYMAAVKGSQTVPTDQFQFGKFLLDEEKEVVRKFQNIVDKQIKLSNLGRRRNLRLEQKTVRYITNFLYMALRDASFMPVFETQYYVWKGSLGLTRAIGGKERMLHAAAGQRLNQAVDSEGFDYVDDAEDEGDLMDQLRRIVGKKQQARSNDG